MKYLSKCVRRTLLTNSKYSFTDSSAACISDFFEYPVEEQYGCGGVSCGYC